APSARFHPVASGHGRRLAGAAEIEPLRRRDLPAVDEDPRRAWSRVARHRPAELESGQHLPRDRLTLEAPGARDVVVPVTARLDRDGVEALELPHGFRGERGAVDDDPLLGLRAGA